MLRLESLDIGYDTSLVTDINASGDTGELICLIGKNGIGKTTLLNTITGVMSPKEGSVVLADQDLSTLNNVQLARLLSININELDLSSELTVRDLLSTGRYPYTNWFNIQKDIDEYNIEKAVNLLKIKELINKRVVTLSQGEKQKALMARTLVQETPVIVMDEPTAHLDFVNRVATLQVLRQICQQEQKLIIVSTHHLDIALKVADKIWLINSNKELIETTPEKTELHQQISTEYSTDKIKVEVSDGNLIYRTES